MKGCENRARHFRHAGSAESIGSITARIVARLAERAVFEKAAQRFGYGHKREDGDEDEESGHASTFARRDATTSCLMARRAGGDDRGVTPAGLPVEAGRASLGLVE